MFRTNEKGKLIESYICKPQINKMISKLGVCGEFAAFCCLHIFFYGNLLNSIKSPCGKIW